MLPNEQKRRADQREQARINEGIAQDPDSPELDDTFFARAKPAEAILPEIVADYRRHRGAQRTPTKVLVSLRLSPDVVDHFKSTGRGWQTRIDTALREVIGKV